MSNLRLATKPRFLLSLSRAGGLWPERNGYLALNSNGRRWASAAPQMSVNIEVLACFFPFDIVSYVSLVI